MIVGIINFCNVLKSIIAFSKNNSFSNLNFFGVIVIIKVKDKSNKISLYEIYIILYATFFNYILSIF